MFLNAVLLATVCLCGEAPERANDFYWENDRTGFRAYGPGDKHRWSGIDVFNKNTSSNVVHSWLRRLGPRCNWHRNVGGLGMDDYAVGPGRGVGGVALRKDGKWLADYGNWTAQRVVANTDAHCAFELDYALPIGGTMTLAIELRRGESLFRESVSFSPDTPLAGVEVGVGLDLNEARLHVGDVDVDAAHGIVSLFERPHADKDGRPIPGEEGATMSAVVAAEGFASVADEPSGAKMVMTRALAQADANGRPVLTVYAGADWTEAGRFTSAAAWQAYVRAFASSETLLAARLPAVFTASAAHYKALDAAATPLRKGKMSNRKGRHNSDLYTPHGWNKWKTGKDEYDMRSIYWWTAGHYPGSLWYLYEATGDAFFRDRAKDWTDLLAPNSTVSDNHDVGFIMYCSYGNARRLLKTDAYDALLKETAESLCRRFNPDLGLIRSWGALDEKKDFLVIPDNMMNLELLEAVSKFAGDPRFDKIARSHADVSMRHHFRADGGCYHVLNYDQRPGFSGTVQEIRRGQGASCLTAWSRGQSWAIYGYAMMYRETKDPAYLAFARKVSDYAIGHPNMPADGVPYWDYGAPGEERDSSAAAIMASGLLELADFVGGEKGASYRAFAVKQLLALASPAYFSEGGEIGHFLLKHGVGNKPGKSEVDTPLDYGDYYFLEALLRFERSRNQP